MYIGIVFARGYFSRNRIVQDFRVSGGWLNGPDCRGLISIVIVIVCRLVSSSAFMI
jgi:hypothetical protein